MFIKRNESFKGRKIFKIKATVKLFLSSQSPESFQMTVFSQITIVTNIQGDSAQTQLM